MSELAFFDSNVLLYADDVTSPEKQRRAYSIFAEHLASSTVVVSVQVLQEYYWVGTRKLGLTPEFAQHRIEILAGTTVFRFEPHDIIAAIELHRLRQIQFWDALIVHAARQAGAAILYSEDFQHGSVLGGVRVVNPFAT